MAKGLSQTYQDISGPPWQVFVDIETEPLENALEFAPKFKAPANYTDPAKIAAHIKEQEQEWLEKAALDARSGRVLVATYAAGDDPPIVLEGEERHVLLAIVEVIRKQLAKGSQVVGYNIAEFDIPFIIQRCWKHRIVVPKTLWGCWRGRFQVNEHVVDLLPIVCAGKFEKRGYSLAAVSNWFGLGTKTDDGKRFGQLYKEDRESALAYAKKDVELTRALYHHIGGI